MSENPTRLNKYLSEIGFCSRREADRYIESGQVLINNHPAEMGQKVTDADTITVQGKNVKAQADKEHVYLAFNKPTGIVCTTDRVREKNNIIAYIQYPTRIFPIGRLDKDSEGLILLTSDGDIVNKILRSRNGHEKKYLVRVDKPITEDFLKKMRSGVPILDTVTKKCEVEQIDQVHFQIILTQGLNRQIRRMCEYLGYEVKKLKRVSVLNIHLDLPSGKWRDLSPEELSTLNALVQDSEKTA